MRVAVELVYDDLRVTPLEETSSLMVRSLRITDRAQEITKCAVRFDVQQVFTVARSHYENTNLEAMGQSFASGYEDDELERIEEIVAAPTRNLSVKIEDEVVP
jgi:hypothetical protein